MHALPRPAPPTSGVVGRPSRPAGCAAKRACDTMPLRVWNASACAYGATEHFHCLCLRRRQRRRGLQPARSLFPATSLRSSQRGYRRAARCREEALARASSCCLQAQCSLRCRALPRGKRGLSPARRRAALHAAARRALQPCVDARSMMPTMHPARPWRSVGGAALQTQLRVRRPRLVRAQARPSRAARACCRRRRAPRLRHRY